MKTSEKIEEVAAALTKAQGAIKPAHKDSVNPAFRSKYASLAAVWDVCREPLAANGLSVLQELENPGAAMSVTTRILHASGQWIELGPLAIPMSKPDAHGAGSAASYCKRYALCAALGIVTDDEDDDATAAVGKDEKAKAPAKSRPAPMPSTKPEPPPEPPDYEVLTDEEKSNIFSAAKASGISTPGALKPVLLRIAGVESAALIPRDKYGYVLEQLALMMAPEAK